MTDIKLPSATEAKVLDLLAPGREMYGLEMVKAGSGLGRNTIYVILGRMLDRGLVTSRTVEDSRSPGLPRRLYKITGLGQKALAARNSVQSIFKRPLAAGWST